MNDGINKNQFMKKQLITFVLCVFNLISTAQVYRAEKQLSPGTTNQSYLNFAKSLKGKFYYLDQKAINKYENGILSKYPRCPKISSFGHYDTVLMHDLEEFQGNIYIASYYRFKVGSDSFGVCFFDGTSWKAVNGTKGLQVTKLCAAGNFLYIADNNGDLYKLDASGTLTKINSKKRYSHLSIMPFNKTEIIWVDTSRIYKYNGTNFDSIPNKYKGYNKNSISDHDSEVYVSHDVYLYKIDKSFKIELLDSGLFQIHRQLIGKIGNYIYTKYYISSWNFEVYDLNAKKFIDVLTITNDYVFSSYGKIYTHNYDISIKGTARIFELTEGVLLEGNIYDDFNKNCSKNKGENPKQKLKLTISNGTETRLVVTNDTGYFRTTVVPGDYDVDVIKKYTNTRYDSCGGNKTFSLGKTYKLDIPYRYDYPKKDIGVAMISERGFLGTRGFSEKYALVYENFGSTTENLILNLEYPDSLTLKSSSANPKSHVGRKLTFEVNNLKKEESGKINLIFEIHAKKQLNSPIIFIYYTDNKANDLDTSNNRDTLKLRTVAAIDPNLKESYPQGYVKNPVTKIKYHIHFQNEGNYYATRVVVVDTFEEKLPLTKLQMIGTKHPYTLRVENGNVLIWEFDNIQLMPKSTDEYGSRGYINFEVPLYKPLKIGETIKNRAHIYFDYEDPLATPYAIVGVGIDPNSISGSPVRMKGIKIFPNPALDQVTIEGNNSLEAINIFNCKGELVFSESSPNNSIEISTGKWASGLYFIVIPKTGVNFRLLKL